jgi:anti-anti-sigma regulatory factor
MAEDHIRFKYPSYIQDILGPMCFDYGFGPFRWVCCSGKDEDLRKTDKIAEQILIEIKKDAPEEIQQQLADNIRWIQEAESNKLVVGSKARILYADALGRMMIAKAFNDAIAKGEIGPVVLGRDHHDVSGTDSPYRETSNIYDGSSFTADMAVHNFVGDAFRGATWVSLHNGGGVGWGEVINEIGSRFGGIPSSLPSPQWLGISWESAQFLVAPAMTLALLGAIESLLCARIADGLTHSRHQPNQELMGQGIANFCVPFLGGMPVTGTIARTVTNIESGAHGPISAIVHSLTLLLIIILAAPLAKNIPLACLAAILIYIAWNMGEWNKFIDFKQFRLPYRITMISVFLLTVMVDLTVAVEVGLLLAFLTFIYRISSLSRIERAQAQDYPFLEDLTGKVTGYRIYGALFFGAVQLLEEIENNLPQNAVVLDFKNVIYIDSTGMDSLSELIHHCHKQGLTVYICGLAHQPHDIAKRSGFYQKMNADYFCHDLQAGLQKARQSIA